MTERTEVILVTGFLGSGKTTFLNRLLQALGQGRKVLVLVNEFGQVGVDGALVDAREGEVLEISKGSIFCICVKRDFIKALYKVATEIKPDVLVMEATGVANPADLKMDLRLPLFQDRFHLLEQICVVDASSFEEEYKVYASVEKQISTSSLFIINKVDLVHPDKVQRVKELIKAHNPEPGFVETTYCQTPLEPIVGRLSPPRRGGGADLGPSADKLFSPAEIEAMVSQMDANPFREITPPDWLMSAAYSFNGGVEEFGELVRELPRGVVRGKGFLSDKDKTWLVNLVMGQMDVEAMDKAAPERLLGKVVFIFPPELETAMDMLANRWSPRLEALPPGEDCG
jgi:G3E family GTPase